MMPVSRISREEALDRIGDVMRRYGYDGASLSRISKATGLGRASLYHHFPGGKEEMAREVFGRLGEQVDACILAPLREDVPPRKRIEKMIRGLEEFYARGDKNCLLGAMVLSGGSDRFSKELRSAFRRWIDSLSRVIRSAGISPGVARRRAESAVGLVQGALVVSRGLGEGAPFRQMLRTLPDQLLARE
jgi:AcrR family transcriptional regulator